MGETIVAEFDANEAGEFGLKCTIFCGFLTEDGACSGHDIMTGILKVVEEA